MKGFGVSLTIALVICLMVGCDETAKTEREATDERAEIVGRRGAWPGSDGRAAQRRVRARGGQGLREPHALDERVEVAGLGEVVGANDGRRQRIGGAEGRLGDHRHNLPRPVPVVAENHIPVQVVALDQRGPLVADQRREVPGLVEAVGGLGVGVAGVPIVGGIGVPSFQRKNAGLPTDGPKSPPIDGQVLDP